MSKNLQKPVAVRLVRGKDGSTVTTKVTPEILSGRN